MMEYIVGDQQRGMPEATVLCPPPTISACPLLPEQLMFLPTVLSRSFKHSMGSFESPLVLLNFSHKGLGSPVGHTQIATLCPEKTMKGKSPPGLDLCSHYLSQQDGKGKTEGEQFST